MIHTQYEITKDKNLLDEYFNLRKISYENDKYMQGHFNEGQVDYYDYCVNSEILIAKKNGKVIGGGRITYSTPERRILLPSESEHFRYIDYFIELDLSHLSFCEFHRFVISPEYRSSEEIYGLMNQLYKRSVQLGMSYAFTPSIRVKARMYKIIFSKIANIETVPGFTLKNNKFGNVPMELMFLDIKAPISLFK